MGLLLLLILQERGNQTCSNTGVLFSYVHYKFYGGKLTLERGNPSAPHHLNTLPILYSRVGASLIEAIVLADDISNTQEVVL